MTLLRVETYEISGGVTEPRRIRVLFGDGREGTYDHPPRSSGINAHEECIAKLITREEFNRVESFYKVGETVTGFRFTIFLTEEDANVSRETTRED